MLVEVQPRSWFSDRAGLEDRALSGNGVIFMRDDIDELQPRLLGDMMRHVPGAQVRTRGNIYSGTWSVQLRGATNMTNDVCNPVIWLDGIKLGNDPLMFAQITGPELDAVEVYRGAAEHVISVEPTAWPGTAGRRGVTSKVPPSP